MKRFAVLLVACMVTIQVAGCGSGGSAPATGSGGADTHVPGEAKAYKAREAAGKVGFQSDVKIKPQTGKSPRSR